MPKTFVVYRITNIKNSRVYFGSTSNFEARRREHLKIMEGHGKGLPNYLRDIRRLGHKPTDFSFRIIARFDNRVEMLQCEQQFLNMYWGTIDCYNSGFEVSEGRVKKTLVVWNMRTLETRQYLSCHAVSKDLGIKKEVIQQILREEVVCSDSWVVELWSKRRTVAEILNLYRTCGIHLPEHALNSKKTGAITPIPGICSIAELVYRQRYKAVSSQQWGTRIRMGINHEAQFW